MVKRAALWLVTTAVLFACWAVFVGSGDPVELVVGAVACVIVSSATFVVVQQDVALFFAHARWVAQIWRLPKDAMTGTGAVLSVLAKQLVTQTPAQSLFVRVRWCEQGSAEERATQRALAISYTTMTPNVIVIGVEEHGGFVLYHQLQRTAVPEMMRRLGACG